ncbi:hypothetical protein PSH54_20415 [Pseudoalteromonas sp. Angola-30]|uniref:hypothetical protein n=1 Tax=Pseudoalteromonas sp. Angola-30 TaxID=3025341 RepID=UPI0023595FDE|nr:hypothetical protein [Pseudoalteromonas sp. Angola-30]MDC9527843.1 hypothetical protein [Pseudoalteromonas sp. Angola-30]
MSIDFSIYTINELQEAWASIDDEAYPDRAIELYQRLKLAGQPLYDDQEGELGVLRSIFQIFSGVSSGVGSFGSDIELENTLCRMKEERVRKLIEFRGLSET